MKRNRQHTEKRIVDAAIDLLAEEGFQSFGVNAVAARAGVDKVLIYRYFDGLDGLLQFIGETQVFFPSAVAMLDSDALGFYSRLCEKLESEPLVICVQNWERVADNPLTQAYRRQRDLFWRDAASLLQPQSDTARSLLSVLSALPIKSVGLDDVSPLLLATEFSPVDPPAAESAQEPQERLADNLL
ncbi:TetR/AcrR family transcriptional regulator [Cerasicoccus fimbriatus]|uniref:TetR/AcrR family transcriptional regulator n=1 Tax=Cerasicoccus fimbriatus TaxID=3014554 RepID=UPI0022B3FB4E|nr:helix-turn-helix domain-containing protein [Cerasicoccus sp. TK19100]